MVVCAFLMEKIITRLLTTGCDKKKEKRKMLRRGFFMEGKKGWVMYERNG